MDLIKSGNYIDIFYAKTCVTTKLNTVAGYHVVLATLLFLKCSDHPISSDFTDLLIIQQNPSMQLLGASFTKKNVD